MTAHNIAEQQLARHIIGWSHIGWSRIAHVLIPDHLPTTIEGSRIYHDVAVIERGNLARYLGAHPACFVFSPPSGDGVDHFFPPQHRLPWMDDNREVGEMVLADFRWMGSGIHRLRNFLDQWRIWNNEEGPLTHLNKPVPAVMELSRMFRGLSSFAAETLPILETDLSVGAGHFYDVGERRRRGLVPPASYIAWQTIADSSFQANPT